MTITWKGVVKTVIVAVVLSLIFFAGRVYEACAIMRWPG